MRGWEISTHQEFEEQQYCYPLVNTSCIKERRPVATRIVLYMFFLTGMTITILGNLL